MKAPNRTLLPIEHFHEVYNILSHRISECHPDILVTPENQNIFL